MINKPLSTCKTCDKPPHPGRRFCLSCLNNQEKEKAKIKKVKEKEKAVIRKVRTTQKKRFSRSNIVKEADRVHSLFTRWRDRGKSCITCGAPWEDNFQCGHFMSRRHLATRWIPINAHTQCPKCNLYGSWEQYAHGQAIDRLYGNFTSEKIQALALLPEKTTDDEILGYIRKYYQELEELGVSSEIIKKKKYYL